MNSKNKNQRTKKLSLDETISELNNQLKDYEKCGGYGPYIDLAYFSQLSKIISSVIFTQNEIPEKAYNLRTKINCLKSNSYEEINDDKLLNERKKSWELEEPYF